MRPRRLRPSRSRPAARQSLPASQRLPARQSSRRRPPSAAEDDLLPALLAAQAARQPAAVALVCGEREVTYGELEAWAETLAVRLRALGAGPEVVVGVLLERSPLAVAALLAIWKSGGAYLPLDPENPRQRMGLLLRDGLRGPAPRLVVTRRELAARLGEPTDAAEATAPSAAGEPVSAAAPAEAVALIEVIAPAGAVAPVKVAEPAPPEDATAPGKSVKPAAAAETALQLLLLDGFEDGPRSSPLAAPAHALSPDLLPDHPAYVIYTSGSTGTPKGIVVSHRSLAHRLRWTRDAELRPGDAFLHKTTLAFDVSLVEIFGPLLAGCRCVLARPGGQRDPLYLADLIERQGITHASFPPSTLQLLLDLPGVPHQLRRLRTLVTGGETVPPELVRRARALLPATLYNRYGPTETTISVVTGACEPEEGGQAVPLGRPIAGARIHVLDEQLEPLPPGAPGEICIGGICLARGYLGRPDLTAEKFVPDPFAVAAGGRLYRSGDRGRWRDDGALEFLGRSDQQVKVRGFRVELAEIEAALAAHPAVREAVVVARDDAATGSRRLAAYLVPAAAAPGGGELRRFLGERLADYMMPASFTCLPSLPRTLSGKVDRNALPAPRPAALAAGARRQGLAEVLAADAPHTARAENLAAEAPRTGLAKALAAEPPRTGLAEALAAESPRIGPAEALAAGAPRTALEETLAALFQDLLALPRVGREESLFDLGGHSLLLVRLQLGLRRRLGIDVSLSAIARHPTVAALARLAAGGEQGGEITPDQLAAEAVLDPSIRPARALAAVAHRPADPRPTARSVRSAAAPAAAPRRGRGERPRPDREPAREPDLEPEPEVVLLTGATGFLGAHVAAELLARTSSRVLCLVRAADEESANQALRRAGERYALWREEGPPPRLTAIAGDLSRPRLGLSAAAFNRLSREIGAVYHCAAQVNFAYPYEALRAANVTALRELLRFTAAGRAKALHHVSTLGVLAAAPRAAEGRAAAGMEEPLGEDRPPLAGGYAQSKWVAERLAESARRRGFAGVVYRPGWIVASSRTGAGNAADLLTRLAVASLDAGEAPDLGAIELCPTPVDYVSAAMVLLSRRRQSLGDVFHLVNPRPVSFARLLEWAGELGYPLARRPLRDWAASLAELAESGRNEMLSPLAGFLRRLAAVAADCGPEQWQPPRFDSRRARAALAGTPLRCPAVDRRFLATFLAGLVERRLLAPRRSH